MESFEFFHGDISNFAKVITYEDYFDFITCTNTAHELKSTVFANLIIDSLIKISSMGELFIYDMESLTRPELGVLPWRGEEIEQLLNVFFEAAGINYKVYPNVWKHSSCRGWTVIIEKQHFEVSNAELIEKRSEIEQRLDCTIDNLLDRRVNGCIRTLQAYQSCGIETAEEEKLKELSLYEFWALYNAKEFHK